MVQGVRWTLPSEPLDYQWYYVMSVINMYIGIYFERVYAEHCPIANMMMFDVHVL